MFKVLIAEDEMFVRLGIKNSINWSKYNMIVIDDVSDGQQAWDSYVKNKPDIILTDLKMPNMDGMELISKIRSVNKKIRIIILSNIEEFKLAQKAMSLGVTGYILKLTMTWDQMDEVLKNAFDEIGEYYELSSERVNEKHERTLLKTEIFSEHIAGSKVSIDCFEEDVIKYNLRLSSKNLILCILEIDKQDNIVELNGNNVLSINKTIINLLNEILDGYNRGEVVYYSKRHYAILFSFKDKNKKHEIKEELCKILDHIKRLMSAYLNLIVTFSISSERDNYQYLKDQYNECTTALLRKIFVGSGINIFFNNEKENIYNSIILPVFKKIINEFIEVFGEENKNEFEKAVSDLQLQNCQSDVDIKRCFMVLLHLPLSIMKIMRQDIFLMQVSYADKIKECETIVEISDIYIQFLKEIYNIIGKKTILSREIIFALQYIKENFQNYISLQHVADHVNLSMNYLSTVFKNSMGINFIDYLQQFRIEKSKELLLNSNLKLYEISEQVGFGDVSYFCRIFKRTTGYPPNEFKRKFLMQKL